MNDKQETTNSLAGSLEYLFEHLNRSIDRGNVWGLSNKSKESRLAVDSRCTSPVAHELITLDHQKLQAALMLGHELNQDRGADQPALDVNGKVIVYHR